MNWAAGKIGWVAKGIVYAILGGLCCKMGVQGSLVEASPQVIQNYEPCLPLNLWDCHNYERVRMKLSQCGTSKLCFLKPTLHSAASALILAQQS